MSPQVFILSKEKHITKFLEELFSSKGCGVFVSDNSKIISSNFNYLVVINFDSAFSGNSDLIFAIESSNIKTVVINGAAGEEIKSTSAVKQIFVDQIFPERSELLNEIVNESAKQHVFIPKEAWISVTSVSALGDKIIEELFSFSENRKILFGKLVSFRELLTAINPSIVISINGNSPQRLPRRDLEIVETPFDLKAIDIPKVEIKTVPVSAPKNKIKLKIKSPKISVPKVNRRAVAAIGITIFIIFLTPYILLAVSTGTSYAAYKAFRGGNTHTARQLISISNVVASVSSKMLSMSSFSPLSKEARLMAQGTEAAGRVLAATDLTDEISEESLNSLHLELSALYRDLSFIDGEVAKEGLPFARFFPEFKNISQYREYVLTASKVSKHLPSLLGFDSPKTYLVLLQNNMELRPTGGFIGSFALVTFSKGEIVDDTIYDVYSADGQLKGYIEPPAPIVNHLGEASWTLRDSNWDPDFPSSAERAEWFLDKSLDRKVDGVIGINLEAAKAFLGVVEPVYLLNFNDTIDSKNMYEKVQYEVENNFFPGSRKKAQYLSALSEALIARIESATMEEYAKLLAQTLGKLDSRDIQIYTHDANLADILREQNWDGGVNIESCKEENCAKLFSGFVEANVGVNKANYFIDRAVNVKATLVGKYFEQEVSLKLVNKATSRDKIPEERYKAYVRAMAPEGSTFHSGFIYSNQGKESIDVDIERMDDRVEYGSIIEVLPGEEKIITFKFRTEVNISTAQSGRISYTWWKQSGTGEYPLNISFTTPELQAITWSPPFRLTDGGEYSYNTNLNEDLEVQLDWNK